MGENLSSFEPHVCLADITACDAQSACFFFEGSGLRHETGQVLASKRWQLSGTSVWRPQSHYTVSHIDRRIKFLQNQRYRAKIALHPPQIKVSHLSPDPPVALSSHSQQAVSKGGVAACWWRVSRHFWVPKTDRATGGVSQLQSHQSRYSVQLRVTEGLLGSLMGFEGASVWEFPHGILPSS